MDKKNSDHKAYRNTVKKKSAFDKGTSARGSRSGNEEIGLAEITMSGGPNLGRNRSGHGGRTSPDRERGPSGRDGLEAGEHLESGGARLRAGGDPFTSSISINSQNPSEESEHPSLLEDPSFIRVFEEFTDVMEESREGSFVSLKMEEGSYEGAERSSTTTESSVSEDYKSSIYSVHRQFGQTTLRTLGSETSDARPKLSSEEDVDYCFLKGVELKKDAEVSVETTCSVNWRKLKMTRLLKFMEPEDEMDQTSTESVKEPEEEKPKADTNYLKSFLGKELPRALLKIALIRPYNPTAYLGHWLLAQEQVEKTVAEETKRRIETIKLLALRLEEERYFQMQEELAKKRIMDSWLRKDYLTGSVTEQGAYDEDIPPEDGSPQSEKFVEQSRYNIYEHHSSSNVSLGAVNKKKK